MYLPKKYKSFQQKYPEVFDSYKELGTVTRHAGPLDEKTQNLVKLGIAIGSNSRGAVMSHTRKAIDTGATKEEVSHAALLALSTVGFPLMISALSWVEEVLEKEGI